MGKNIACEQCPHGVYVPADDDGVAPVTAPTALIRRDAVLALVEKAGLLSDPEDGLRSIANGVLALPADTVGEAAGKLADYAIDGDPWRQVHRGLWRCDYCRATGELDNLVPLSEMIDPDTVLKHSQGCAWETYRAAVSARDAKEPR